MKRDDVLEIANRLKNEGRAISPVTVCLEAYGQSLPEIAETLQQWRDERMTPVDAGLASLPTPDDFGDVMRDAIERCWAVAQKGVRGQVDAEMRALRERTEQAERETGMLYIDLTRTLHELEAYKRKLAEFQHSPAGATRLISAVEEHPVPAIAENPAATASDTPAETESHLPAFDEPASVVEEHASEAPLDSDVMHEHAMAEHAVSEQAVSEHAASEHAVSEHTVSEHAVSEHAASEHTASEHEVPEHAASEHIASEHALSEHPVSEHAVPEHAASEHVVSEHAASEHAVPEHAALEEAVPEDAVLENAAHDFTPEAVAFGETEAVHSETSFDEPAQASSFEPHVPAESTEDFAGFDQQDPLAAEPENANGLGEQLALAEARASAAEARVQELEAELAIAAQAAHVPVADPTAAHAAQEEAAQRIAELEQAFAQERQTLQTKLDEAILHCAQWKQRAEQLRADFTPLKEHAAWVNAQSVGRSTLCSRLIVELARVSPGNPLLRKEVQQQIVDQAAQTHAG